MPGMLEYRRNYLEQSMAGFDVVTEVWFADRESLDRAMAAIEVPEVAQRVAEDEMNFLDRSVSCATVVEICGGAVSSTSLS